VIEKYKARLGKDLYAPCCKGDINAISTLTQHRRSLDPSYAPSFSIILAFAAYYDHAHLASWCLNSGATVSDTHMRSVIVGAFKTHKVLIEAKAVDIDYYVMWFGTVLSVASADGHYEWTKSVWRTAQIQTILDLLTSTSLS
jgi:hypothetical protein